MSPARRSPHTAYETRSPRRSRGLTSPGTAIGVGEPTSGVRIHRRGEDLVPDRLDVQPAWRLQSRLLRLERRPPSCPAVSDARIGKLIHQIHAGSRGTYGSPRFHAELAGRARCALLSQACGSADADRPTERRLPPSPRQNHATGRAGEWSAGAWRTTSRPSWCSTRSRWGSGTAEPVLA